MRWSLLLSRNAWHRFRCPGESSSVSPCRHHKTNKAAETRIERKLRIEQRDEPPTRYDNSGGRRAQRFLALLYSQFPLNSSFRGLVRLVMLARRHGPNVPSHLNRCSAKQPRLPTNLPTYSPRNGNDSDPRMTDRYSIDHAVHVWLRRSRAMSSASSADIRFCSCESRGTADVRRFPQMKSKNTFA